MENVWEYLIRVDSDLSGTIKDLLELEAINARLQNQNLENARKSREEATARKQLAEEAKQAAQAQIAAELGVSKTLDGQKGIIEELRARIKLLKQGREQADDIASINKYNAALQVSQKQLNELTGATDKFKGSNGFWREMQGWVMGALAGSIITDWTSKIFAAQTQIEGFKLSLNRLVGEQQATKIFNELTAAIAKTPLEFEGATKGVEKLIFAYQDANKSTKNIVNDFIAFGNVAKGNEENLKGITKGLADTAAAGKATAQEFNQFSNAGVNLFQLLADSTGMSRKELLKFREDGKISFDMVRDAILKAGSEGGRFFGAMTVQSQTVGGKISNFKDVVFQSMGAVGNQFADVAKKVIAFGTSTISSLFGTESQAKRTIDLVKTGIAVWASYEIATRASAAATVVWNGVQRAGLIIKGQAILATEAYIGMTIAETEAQIAATTAARSFNATLAANPIGLIVLAIGAAVTAYQLYSNSVEAAQEEQKKLSSGIADALTPLRAEQLEFNKLSKEVLNNKLTIDQRNKALDTLQEKFPIQMKGIGDLKEAELKLGGVIRSTNNDYIHRAKLLENEVKLNFNREKANIWLKEQIELESKLATASNKTSTVVTQGGEIRQFISERAEIEKAIAARKRWVENAMKANQDIANSSDKVTEKLTFNYEKEEKAAAGAGAGTGKANKEKVDSIKTLALIQEKAANDSLEKTRRTEQRSLELERDIAIQRINDSKASETKKSAERLKIVEKYFVDSSKLTNKYDDEEAKQQQKANEKWLKENYEMHKDTIEQAAKRMAEVQKLNEKDYKEKQKLDEKAAKETEKLNQDKYELFDKLRILDRISHAKNSKELIEIENDEKEKILEGAVKSSERLVLVAQLRLARMKATYGEDSVKYKDALADMIISQQNFTQDSIKLAEFKADKTKDALKKEEDAFKAALGYATQVTDGLFALFDKSLDNRLAKSTNAVEKRMLEHTKAEMEITKNALGAITSLASGDIPGAISKGITAIFSALNAEMEREMKLQEEKVAEYARIMGERINKLKEGVQATTSSMSEMNKIYADLIPQTIYKAQEAFIDSVGRGSRESISAIDQRIQLEIKYGQQIIDNYEKAVQAEEKLYNDKVANINKEFDLRDLKATQAYNAQTLAITAAGSAQLEALITNEASLASVREEFAAKRLAIEQSFPLASKAITADMSQAEIDAINASIKARDEQFAKIQEWYNDELIFIATSEGQKRKEYTDTEKIQNQIREKLELAAIKFEADEITRNQEKQAAILLAEQEKNANLVKLEEEKNIALAASFQRLTDFMKQQIAEVQSALAALKPENVEQFKELQAILESIRNTYRDLTGINPSTLPIPSTPTTTETPARGPRGFFNGTERLPNMSGRSGVDTELIRADVGERIMQTGINNQLKSFFGRDLTNNELAFRAMNSTMPMMNYEMLANMNNNANFTTDKELLKGVNELIKVTKNKKEFDVTYKNGYPTIKERSSNRMIIHA